MAIEQHTKNPPKSVRWKMRKIGDKDFQLSLQETQFQEDHKFRQNI